MRTFFFAQCQKTGAVIKARYSQEKGVQTGYTIADSLEDHVGYKCFWMNFDDLVAWLRKVRADDALVRGRTWEILELTLPTAVLTIRQRIKRGS